MQTLNGVTEFQSIRIRNLREFLQNHLDHSWLIATLPPHLFTESHMQNLRNELYDMEYFGVSGFRLEHCLQLTGKLHDALSKIDISRLRTTLRRRNGLGLRQEFVLSTLETNIRSLENQIRELTRP